MIVVILTKSSGTPANKFAETLRIVFPFGGGFALFADVRVHQHDSPVIWLALLLQFFPRRWKNIETNDRGRHK